MRKKDKRALALAKRAEFERNERERGLQFQKTGRAEDAKRKQLKDAKLAAEFGNIVVEDRPTKKDSND